MRVLVCGGRDYQDKALVYAALDALDRKHGISAIIHGDARGADRLGKAWGIERERRFCPIRPTGTPTANARGSSATRRCSAQRGQIASSPSQEETVQRTWSGLRNRRDCRSGKCPIVEATDASGAEAQPTFPREADRKGSSSSLPTGGQSPLSHSDAWRNRKTL